MLERFKLSHRWVVGLLGLIVGLVLGATFLTRSVLGLDSHSSAIARGAGTTIIQGGTGSPGFVPVLTTLAFHAEREAGTVTGAFECLARAPEKSTGSGSAQFTVNAMYVTGQITEATVSGDTATLSGISMITGLGAGSNVPFHIVVRGGGPGTTAVLTTEGSPRLAFSEVLLEGSFEIFHNGHE
jgi:hypothetical protein